MAEITGGELGFEFTLDAENLKKGLTDSECKLMGFTEVAEKAGTTLQSSFDKSGSKVKDFTGIVRENISIQKQVIKELESQIKEVQNRASDIAPGIGQATILSEAKALEKELAGEKAALADLELAMGKAATTSTTLGTKLAEAKNRLAELNLASKEGKEVTAEQFREAEAEVKKYGEAISDTNARTKALTAGTIGSLAQGLSLVTGTMAMGTSLMGAFGGKSEELNQIMLKTQALLAATVTLQEIKNTTVQKGGVISGIMTVQEYARARGADAAALASGRATIAQRAWNLVANANPYILLATAIISVVGAIALYSLRAKSAANTQKELNDAIKQGTGETAKEIISLERLYKTATNDKLSREQRVQAVKDLKKEFPGLFGQINDEIILNGKAAASYFAVRDAIIKSARAKAASSIIEKKTEDLLLSQEEAKLKVAEKLARIQKLESAKKTGAKTMKVDFADIGNDYSGTVSIDEQLKLQKSGLNILLKGVTKGAQDFTKANRGLLKVIEDGQTAMFDATTAPPPTKGTDAYWQSEIERLEELKSKTQTGSKAWKEYGDQIKAIQDKINPPKEKAARKTKEKVADEFLPPGSVAEIQKRLAEIDKALSRSNNDGSTKLLKARRMEIALELAAAEKKIRIKTFDEELADTKKQIELRDRLLQAGYSKEKVDSMLPEVKDKSYIGYLEETATSLKNLVAAGDNTEQTAENLIAVQEVINEFKGYSSFIDNVSKSLENLKSKFSGTELISELEKYKNSPIPGATEAESNARRLAAEKAIEAENKAIEDKQRRFYADFLKEKETFEQKKKAIDEKYDSIDASINNSDKSADEKARLLAESGKARGQEYSEAFIEGIANSEMWKKAFGQINEMTTSEIRKSIEYLTKQLESKEVSGNPEKTKIITDQIKSLQSVLNNNPFEKIRQDYKKMMDVINDPNASLESKLEAIQGLFNSLSVGLQAVGDAFGGFDDATNDAIGNIMAIGNSAFDLAKSISSGDVAGMISAGIKLIGSIGKALNGDKKKEREIKKQAAALKELEKVYNDLGRAIDKALGEGVFTASQDAITNLKQQKAILEQMMRTEQSKKKADKEKINGYKDQINSINNAIEDMQQSMIDKVLNGLNAKGLADKLSDALTTAFQNGEDAATAMGKTVDDILRDMVKNALKMKILEPAMQAVVDKMLASMGYSVGANGITGTFDGLTEAEREELKNMMNQAGTNYMDALGAYTDLFGSQAGNAQGLKGDIKGITEKTAGALEAQINAMRQYQVEGLNIHRNNQQTFIASLQNLVMIEFNTRHLIQIQKDISEMNGKMAKGLAGI